MGDWEAILTKARILPLVPRLVPQGEAVYLVGGAVRDQLLGRQSRDFDFATAFDPTEMAQEFARQIAGTWFWLDKERRQSRVVRKPPSGPVYYDFAPFRASTLENDLRERDFTLNAIALKISAAGIDSQYIDPLNGQQDLQQRQLRICGPEVLQDDPLRVLRAIRYALLLDCDWSVETEKALTAASETLPLMPPERIGAELLQCWAAGKIEPFCDRLTRLELLEFVFGTPCRPNQVQKSLTAFHAVQRELTSLSRGRHGKRVQDLLNVTWQPECSTQTILLLGVFLAAGGMRRVNALLRQRWCLGKGPSALIEDLGQLSRDSWLQLKQLPRTPRARALWIESLGAAAEEKALWHLLMNSEDRSGQSVALQALEEWPSMHRHQRVPDLVGSQWLQQVAKIRPGPQMGALLQHIKQEELCGRVRTQQDAMALVLGKKPLTKG